MTDVNIIQKFSFPGEICRKFALNWSADNKISICTSKAIYILSSNCSLLENGFPFPIHKQAIRVPKKPLHLLTIDMPSNPYKYIKTEKDKDNLHRFLMDHTLNSKPSERVETFLSFRCCKWSPKGAAKGGRCLLATLTLDHRLALYEEQVDEWKCVCDLSEILIKHQNESNAPAKLKKLEKNEAPPVKPSNKIANKKKDLKHKLKKKKTVVTEPKELTSEPAVEEKKREFNIEHDIHYDELRKKLYKIAPMEIIWTGMFGTPSSSSSDSTSEFCFLIVATKCGNVQFWKVSATDSPCASLVHEWDSALGMITSLCWQQTSQHSGFLLCGSLRGVLSFLPVSITLDADQEPQVTFRTACNVWDEEDSIAVDHISILKIALKKYVIIAAKMHALVGCEIVQTDLSIVIRNVGHSFGLHRLPVTGMAVLDSSMPQYRIIMSTMEGMLVEIKVSLKCEEIKFQHEKIPIDLDFKNHRMQGLAVSSNGLLCGVVLDTSSHFDHLVRKEPLQFVMFVTRPFEEVWERLHVLLTPQFPFAPSIAPTRYSDFLECLRTSIACGSPLPEWLTSLLKRDFTTCSTLELHFIRFILHAYSSGLQTVIPEDNYEEKLRAAEAALMTQHVSTVFGRCQENIDLLAPAQGLSLLLMADWLLRERQAPVAGLYAALGAAPPEPDAPAREECASCGASVPLEGLRSASCSNGHAFARCCRSMLLCSAASRLRCSGCAAAALPGLWDGVNVSCTFCGSSMS